MDATLATVTIISLLLAWAMAVVTRQRIRAERRLSDARAAALMAELTGNAALPEGPHGRPESRPPMRPESRPPMRPESRPPMRPESRPPMRPGSRPPMRPGSRPPMRPESRPPMRPESRPPMRPGSRPPMRPGSRPPMRPAPRPPIMHPAAVRKAPPGRLHAPVEPPVELRLPFTAPEDTLGARGEMPRATAPGVGPARQDPPARRPDLWREVLAPTPRARPRWGHRLAAVAVGTVLVAGVSLADLTPGLRDPPAAAVPVELLSLDHRRQGDYLAVSGSLRNPPGGKERAKLSITATVFDRTGAVVGTGQTPLPVTVLSPGSDTAFTISLPDADVINRYRVSFMEGHVSLPHVDRRHAVAPGDAAMPVSVGTRP